MDQLEEFFSTESIPMKQVKKVEALLDRMTGGDWDEECDIGIYADIPLANSNSVLAKLQDMWDLSNSDIKKIKVMLFGSGAQKIVKEIKLESGKFDGRYALFATEVDDSDFHLFVANYTLSFSNKLKTSRNGYDKLKAKHSDLLDYFFRYKAMSAFEEKFESLAIDYNELDSDSDETTSDSDDSDWD